MSTNRIAILIFFSYSFATNSITNDKENCLICHEIPYLSLQEEDGGFRSFVVNADNFSHSIHRNVSCQNCHNDISTFPHQENINAVDCAQICHISRPFGENLFSHSAQVEKHQNSIHGFNPTQTVSKNLEKPTCKYCHANTVIERPSEKRQIDSNHCNSCHDGAGVDNLIVHLDLHIEHRSAQNSKKIVELCSSCHSNYSKMEQFDINRNQVEGFERQFHGKALNRGLDSVANCADCHTNHFVLNSKDSLSSIHSSNIVNTCSGNNICHLNPTLEFTKAGVHSVPTQENNPILFYVEWGFIILTAGVMALLFTHILLDLIRYFVDKRRVRL